MIRAKSLENALDSRVRKVIQCLVFSHLDIVEVVKMLQKLTTAMEIQPAVSVAWEAEERTWCLRSYPKVGF